MRDGLRYIYVACLVVAVAAGGLWVGGAIADNSDSVAECPDGQELVGFTVKSAKGTLSVEQPGWFPPGTTFETRGGDVATKASARAVSVHGDEPLDLKVECRGS